MHPPAPKPVDFAAARADFDQDGWTAAMAIDGKPDTAWGIFPEVGKPHAAVFELKQPLGDRRRHALTFKLEQTHGGGHLIGRFRLRSRTPSARAGQPRAAAAGGRSEHSPSRPPERMRTRMD